MLYLRNTTLLAKMFFKITFVCMLSVNGEYKAQAFTRGDVFMNVNIGVPHLFKNVVKIAANSSAFENNFDGRLTVSTIRGLNPVAIRTEYAFNKFFGLGLNYSFWNIRFRITDHYNFQNQNVGTFYSDSVDVYDFKISSKSFGIRPNFHFPLKSNKHDLYIGVGLGFTKNKLVIGFHSTDAGRFVKNFHRDLQYDLSLPGGLYFAPTIGYRTYMNSLFGFNFEVGYEKGAVLQAGVIFKIRTGSTI